MLRTSQVHVANKWQIKDKDPFHCSCFSSCLEQSCPLEIEHDPRMWAMEEILNFVVAMLKKKKKKEIGN